MPSNYDCVDSEEYLCILLLTPVSLLHLSEPWGCWDFASAVALTNAGAVDAVCRPSKSTLFVSRGVGHQCILCIKSIDSLQTMGKHERVPFEMLLLRDHLGKPAKQGSIGELGFLRRVNDLTVCSDWSLACVCVAQILVEWILRLGIGEGGLCNALFPELRGIIMSHRVERGQILCFFMRAK